MRYSSIRTHLRPYVIVARRRTTINHTFASAIAPHDTFDEARIRSAISTLGQDPDAELLCAYCGAAAQTWDHVFATVRDSQFSGHGHQIGNLLPCCKPCNSAKGNKHWRAYLDQMGLADTSERAEAIARYLIAYPTSGTYLPTPEHARLDAIRTQVISLLAEADQVAKALRERVG
jgi:5-methylcytosine-specific restriction endonuclease McrA